MGLHPRRPPGGSRRRAVGRPVRDPTDTTTDPTIDDAIIDDSSEFVDGSDGSDPTDSVDPTDTTVDDTTDTTVDDTDSTDTTDTTVDDTTDPTDVTVDPILWEGKPCWFGVIDPGHCYGWSRVHIDPPVIDPPDTSIDDTPDPTDIVDVPAPRVYCIMKSLPDPGVPLGISEDGSISITGLDPAVLPADDSFDGGVITIYGTGFQPGATVMIGDLECTSVEILSETSLTCDPPVGELGSYDIVVINPGGNVVVAPTAFEFADPAGFWLRPVFAFSTNPLERSITTTTAPTGSGAETLADTGIGADAPAIPVFTG